MKQIQTNIILIFEVVNWLKIRNGLVSKMSVQNKILVNLVAQLYFDQYYSNKNCILILFDILLHQRRTPTKDIHLKRCFLF